MALLADYAFARSGDKGDICNIGIIAKSPRYYAGICSALTPERVKEFLGDLVQGEVRIYRLDNLEALNVVLHGALGGGATRTVRFDQTGKAMSTALLRLPVEALA